MKDSLQKSQEFASLNESPEDQLRRPILSEEEEEEEKERLSTQIHHAMGMNKHCDNVYMGA